uniref:ATP synthase complex subunit 8 n=1 Tax=Crangon hakodatei TaxID=1884866 RepID=A0A1C9CYD6_9EUCA|nr:ATP synthase F0 subunit 8 [Crangon hakodatei]
MPQMSPLLWLNLYVMFSATFLLFLAFNYFYKSPIKKEKITSEIHTSTLTWKW